MRNGLLKAGSGYGLVSLAVKSFDLPVVSMLRNAALFWRKRMKLNKLFTASLLAILSMGAYACGGDDDDSCTEGK